MTPENSPAALALPAPASLYVRLPAAGRVPDAVTRAGPERGFRRLASALGDVAALVAVAYAFPLAILAIGIPIVLVIRLLMWLVGALSGAMFGGRL